MSTYDQTLKELNMAAEVLLGNPQGHFFQTQARNVIYGKYLHAVATNALELNGDDQGTLRWSLNCSHCARFMSRVGGVVYHDGLQFRSVYWNPDVVTDPVMKAAVAVLKETVESARITSLFDKEGSYSTYVETTNNGGKQFRHFYIPAQRFLPKSRVTGNELPMPKQSKFTGQMTSLITFLDKITYTDVLTVKQMFEGQDIEHADSSAKNLEDLLSVLSHLTTLKHGEWFSNLPSDYHRETVTVNAIWRYGLTHQNLLGVRGTLLGRLVRKVSEQLVAGKLDKAPLVGFWKEQTNGLNHHRTKRPAGARELQDTLKFLKDNDFLPALPQLPATLEEIPALWRSKQSYVDPVEAKKVPVGSFEAFVENSKADKTEELLIKRHPNVVDIGSFLNEIMGNMESMAIILELADGFSPALFTRIENLEAKRILRYDQHPVKRAPFVCYTFDEKFTVGSMLKEVQPPKHRKVLTVPQTLISIDAITSHYHMGIETDHERSEKECSPYTLTFLFGNLKTPMPMRPGLFAQTLVGELYDHRRALEDYMRNTNLPDVPEGLNQAVGLPFGQFNDRSQRRDRRVTRTFRVQYTPEYAVLMGSAYGEYIVAVDGWLVQPDLDKMKAASYEKVEAEAVAE